jgi:AcrR family transcriptional regulator
VAETRPYHHGDLPSALLDAVDGLLREGGIEAVSLRAAATRGGVPRCAGTPRRRQGWLLAAYARQGFERFESGTPRGSGADRGPGEDRLRAMALAYLGFADDDRARFEVMFRLELVGEHLQAVHAAGAASFAVLADEIAACLDDAATEEDVAALSLSTWSTVHGLATLAADGVLEAMGHTVDTIARSVLATLRDGMRPHPLGRGHER